MGNTSSRSTQENVVKIFMDQVTQTALDSTQTFSASNLINIKGCSGVDLSQITQSNSAFVSQEAFQTAMTTAAQNLDLSQILKQQADMIAQNVNLATQDMDTVQRNLTEINQTLRTMISTTCQQSAAASNTINLEDCAAIRATLISQTNAVSAALSCVQRAIQNTSQFVQLSQTLDQATKLEVKNAINSIVMLILALIGLVFAIALFPGIAAGGLFKAVPRAAQLWLACALLIPVMHVYMYRAVSQPNGGALRIWRFTIVPGWCRTSTHAAIGVAVIGLLSSLLVFAAVRASREPSEDAMTDQ